VKEDKWGAWAPSSWSLGALLSKKAHPWCDRLVSVSANKGFPLMTVFATDQAHQIIIISS